METVVNPDFWRDKRVFITGHTGFKGGWLAMWLQHMGADLKGFALPAATTPNLYEAANIESIVDTTFGDIRDLEVIKAALNEAQPEIVFHLAAQPLVRFSYQDPVGTYAANVMGSVHLLEAVRHCSSVRAVVMVTSDKCYENREWEWGYRENEPMGGYDPYSNSKGCTELVVSAYRSSFFNPADFSRHGVAIASARAGNVVGGGDWADDRLVPDFIRAMAAGEELCIRSPNAIRPWQHVLEPLSGYIALAQRLVEDGVRFAQAWNFGPREQDAQPVGWLVERLVDLWGNGASWRLDGQSHLHEANYLKLDISKAQAHMQWVPRWSLDKALINIVDWYKAYYRGENVQKLSIQQIDSYMNNMK